MPNFKNQNETFWVIFKHCEYLSSISSTWGSWRTSIRATFLPIFIVGEECVWHPDFLCKVPRKGEDFVLFRTEGESLILPVLVQVHRYGVVLQHGHIIMHQIKIRHFSHWKAPKLELKELFFCFFFPFERWIDPVEWTHKSIKKARKIENYMCVFYILCIYMCVYLCVLCKL